MLNRCKIKFLGGTIWDLPCKCERETDTSMDISDVIWIGSNIRLSAYRKSLVARILVNEKWEDLGGIKSIEFYQDSQKEG